MVLAESSVSRPSRYASFDTSARPRSGCYEEDRGGAGYEVAAAAGEEPTSHSSHTDWQDGPGLQVSPDAAGPVAAGRDRGMPHPSVCRHIAQCLSGGAAKRLRLRRGHFEISVDAPADVELGNGHDSSADGPNQHALTGTFAPDLTLHTDRGTTSVAELMHTARPVLLDLRCPDRPGLHETARDWQHRIDIRTAKTDHRPADALLIRPDAPIAWAATTGEPADTAALALREALSCWFGTPLKTTVPIIDRPS